MDIRWNATYLMLKHLVPYSEVFSVFINSNYGVALLSPNHWHVAKKLLEFLEIFYDCTVVLSSVYYPPVHLFCIILEITTHLHAAEKDVNLRSFVYPMQLKFLKYWPDIPLLYLFAFILVPRAKLRGFHKVLQLLHENTGSDYNMYYAVKLNFISCLTNMRGSLLQVGLKELHNLQTKQVRGNRPGGESLED
jgi:hypothetical protein